MDLTEFLTARYDEEQQLAQAAAPGPWHVELLGAKGYPQRISNAQATVIGQTYTSPTYAPAGARHIAYWDPARVVADLAAKRALIQLAFRYAADFDQRSGCGHTVEQIATGACPFVGEMESMDLLRLLAAPYSEHPDFDPAWRTDD